MWKSLKGESDKVHPESEKVGYELAGGSAVSQGKYKMVINSPPRGTGEWELYDMETDPAEMNNLAEKMPELVEELKAAYEEYEIQNGVIAVPSDYDPELQAIKNSTAGKSH